MRLTDLLTRRVPRQGGQFDDASHGHRSGTSSTALISPGTRASSINPAYQCSGAGPALAERLHDRAPHGKSLTPDERKALAARDRAMLWLLLSTVIRLSELCGLHFCDIDWKLGS